MKRIKLIALVSLAVLVVAGHVGLWASDGYTADQKLKLTVLNAVAWAVIFLPAFGVAMWARAHRRDDGEDGPDAKVRPRDLSSGPSP